MKSNKKTMINEQLIKRGIHDQKLIDAFKKVPREAFLEDDLKQYAYVDSPLTIGNNQTISQPYMVAYMSEALDLKNTDKVLEIGTGSGYQTAILAELVNEVYTIERIKNLSDKAQTVLHSMNYDNIHFIIGNGTKGYKDVAPYDKTIVTAAATDVPHALFNQLANNGKLIMPVGERFIQDLMLYEKKDDTLYKSNLGGCRFVPLINH
ncbi:MAG: protein-L-isoaspartate(D-aspartate) O-methyltransferase [Candidatus Izimaplasma sp.]|nr:protein-L-isoaspartate(D-aspartate) O-methyltransferase [Candidatus Izimaplasma bacterium]